MFEDGAKVLIFDIINRQIKDLQDAHQSFSRETRFSQDLADTRLNEAIAKEREMQEFTKVLGVKFDNLVAELARLTEKESRDCQALTKRADDLAAWLKSDSEKLFDQMAKVHEIANECDDKVRTYSQVVSELQTSEDRNDAFMKQLLSKAESLELFKVDKKVYQDEKQGLLDRLDKFDRYNKENHVHYIQIENYLDKFLRLKVQQQIGRSLAAAFDSKRSTLEKYRTYEENFLKEANKAILSDDGQPDVMESMHRDFLRML